MINDVTKNLRTLPYTDMMRLARMIGAGLHKRTNHTIPEVVLAEVLADIAETEFKPSAEAQQEHKILREIFNRRRLIVVAQQGAGWTVEIQALHAQVLGTDLKTALIQLIDTAVVARALVK